nr:hypothetical protein GCM10020241_16690 [Streptoalloteichus tenebrarius]
MNRTQATGTASRIPSTPIPTPARSSPTRHLSRIWPPGAHRAFVTRQCDAGGAARVARNGGDRGVTRAEVGETGDGRRARRG